jgi:FKBP-type peptidyl-prolyl cis-trans isomerase
LLPALLLLLALAACDANEDDSEITVNDVVEGTGATVAVGDHVIFDYIGRLESGCLFNEGELNTTPTSGKLIEGLEQGLIGMRIGGTRRIIVPPSLGLGDRTLDGIECDVPSKATLVFEVTAKEIVEYSQTDLVVGNGDEATVGRTATVNYTGTLDDGTEFESGSFSFTVGGGRAIPGFDRGVEGMRVGGRRSVRFPPSLGYGPPPDYGSNPRNTSELRYSILNFTLTLESVR